MTIETKIEGLISPLIDGLGYEIVRVMMTGGMRPTLQIMIDNKNGKPIIVDDCVKVSKTISEVLDENIDNEYNLEVSSPGIDRPLIKIEHFIRFTGFDARVETSREIDGRKRFKGKIVSVKGQDINIDIDGKSFVVPFDSVAKAKLILTDELLKAYEEDLEN